MAQMIVFLAMFFAIGVLPPIRWGLRIAALLALLLVIAAVTLPTPYDRGNFGDLDRVIAMWVTGTVLVGIVLRGLIALAFTPSAPTRAEALGLALADRLLQAGFGVVLGCLTFQMLAFRLQGLNGGLALHITVAVLSLLATLALWRTPLRATALGAGVLVAALSLDGGLHYPDLILTDATRLLPDQPRCLMLGPDLRPPATRADLMALTMAKDRKGPSDALLLIQVSQRARLYRWSFRNRSFVQAPPYVHATPLCTPTSAPILPD